MDITTTCNKGLIISTRYDSVNVHANREVIRGDRVMDPWRPREGAEEAMETSHQNVINSSQGPRCYWRRICGEEITPALGVNHLVHGNRTGRNSP